MFINLSRLGNMRFKIISSKTYLYYLVHYSSKIAKGFFGISPSMKYLLVANLFHNVYSIGFEILYFNILGL